MCQKFYYTAKFFVDGAGKETRYFQTQQERDIFVLEHDGWKKRGKICVENLEKHLEKNK